jgi:hypothetical protein
MEVGITPAMPILGSLLWLQPHDHLSGRHAVPILIGCES